MSYHYEVAVVGCGPVGAIALAMLGRAGISAIGIEREATTWPHARAVHFDGETLRTLQALGIGELACALCEPMTEFRMENEAGELLFELPTGQFGPQAWHDDLMFHQPDMETLVRGELERYPNVRLCSGVTLLDFTQDIDGVRCRVENANGTTEFISVRWVIACDGANSQVRRQLGIETEKLGSDDPWLVVDGLLRDSPGLPGTMAFLGHHSRPGLWVRLPGERVRMEFKVMPDDDLEEIVTRPAIERISRGVLPVADFEPDRIAVYTFRARVAEQWRVGNVFLAGDAAHQAPPLFGQGLCAGMRDVTNLVWKLKAVARGTAAPELLDTYQSERLPHARYWVEKAATMAHLVQTTDPATAAGRDAHIRSHPQDVYPPLPALGPGLHTGPGDPNAGHLSQQPMLADGTRLDDIVGVRFLLATTAEIFAGLPENTRIEVETNPEIVVLTGTEQVAELLASVDSKAIVVRPDRYVLGTADTAARLAELLTIIPALTAAPRVAAAPVVAS
ncbi:MULTISPECIES: bifunctional 3-(3-hydroxy-phenyl)propionate/3-hydroxycinnamic acid hydroxylase [unclassified Nocardia]|uniref:bifunctional 3-(3-hydroxy-phenyl)propionate/3-hydroxycinnamic acid hydroxylase n=1 Tax=unclassified Nocardia TaxID=2637762 RepID=UPI0034145180